MKIVVRAQGLRNVNAHQCNLITASLQRTRTSERRSISFIQQVHLRSRAERSAANQRFQLCQSFPASQKAVSGPTCHQRRGGLRYLSRLHQRWDERPKPPMTSRSKDDCSEYSPLKRRSNYGTLRRSSSENGPAGLRRTGATRLPHFPRWPGYLYRRPSDGPVRQPEGFGCQVYRQPLP